ncbi:MAG: recombinase family protein [Defluviitaleaceae bacterium]|nr:recombinase family protein [Defluviitaleaceae bacterium]
MQEMKYKAIKYIRLSSADEAGHESDSVGNQRKLINEYLKAHPEIEVIGEKVDDGWSGILFDRPAFKEMMEEIEQGNVNCVITKDLSRFGREYIETGRYLRRIFPAYGVRFVAINDNIDTLTDSGDDLSVSLKSIINDAYCRDISVKVRSALAIKRKSGDFVGAYPVYGYIRAEENRNRLAIDEYPAGIVREIFQLKLDGHSADSIAHMLNERGILSPLEYKKHMGLPHAKGGFADKDDAKWSATAIFRILNDETYVGTLVQGKISTPNYKLKERQIKPEDEWQKTENAHEPIISKNRFVLVQKIMRLDTRTSPHDKKVYTFSGILICGSCGTRMTRKLVPYKGSKYVYYFCPAGKKNDCAASGMLKEKELADCVLDSIKAHISNIVELERLLATLDAGRVAKELAKTLTEQLYENDLRLSKIREFKAGLYETMISGDLNKDEYKSLKAKYTDDANVLAQANAKLRAELEDTLSLKHERMAWLEQFKAFEDIQTLDRRAVICLIHSIYVHSKTDLEITFNYKAEYETALNIIEGSLGGAA